MKFIIVFAILGILTLSLSVFLVLKLKNLILYDKSKKYKFILFPFLILLSLSLSVFSSYEVYKGIVTGKTDAEAIFKTELFSTTAKATTTTAKSTTTTPILTETFSATTTTSLYVSTSVCQTTTTTLSNFNTSVKHIIITKSGESTTKPATKPITTTATALKYGTSTTKPATKPTTKTTQSTTRRTTRRTTQRTTRRTTQSTTRRTTTTTTQYYQTNDYASQMLSLINNKRKSQGIKSLKPMVALDRIAMQRAKEISTYFSHTRPNGTSPEVLLKQYGLSYSVFSENLSAGASSAINVMNTWYNSPSHKANMLNSSIKYVGSAMYYASDKYHYYWVQVYYSP